MDAEPHALPANGGINWLVGLAHRQDGSVQQGKSGAVQKEGWLRDAEYALQMRDIVSAQASEEHCGRGLSAIALAAMS